MKETLFEMLLNLFETTLLRLKEVTNTENKLANSVHDNTAVEPAMPSHINSEKMTTDIYQLLILKEAQPHTIRVFTPDEQMRMSKSSQQFLLKLNTWGIISREVMELIINRLLLSDSYIVSLQETKWIIRTLLADKISSAQLAYLDLVLYHDEDAIVKH